MTASKLYTVVLEYKGGTYIAQVSASSPAAALPKWVSGITAEELAEWKITPDELTTITKSDDLVPITGCFGVWCVSGSTKDGLVLINVIATDGLP
jgi:hypothetical protein